MAQSFLKPLHTFSVCFATLATSSIALSYMREILILLLYRDCFGRIFAGRCCGWESGGALVEHLFSKFLTYSFYISTQRCGNYEHNLHHTGVAVTNNNPRPHPRKTGGWLIKGIDKKSDLNGEEREQSLKKRKEITEDASTHFVLMPKSKRGWRWRKVESQRPLFWSCAVTPKLLPWIPTVTSETFDMIVVVVQSSLSSVSCCCCF